MSRPNLLSLFEQFLVIGRDTAIIQTLGYRRQRFTYSDLYARALSRARLLASHSINPGDRVLLWGPNSFKWISCFWAILLRGAVVVPMDAGASSEFVQRVARESQVKLILCDSAQPEIPGGPPNLVYTNLPDHPNSVEDAAIARATRADLAEILFTSGTTSEPRGVLLTHGNFLSNLEPLEQGINEYRKYEHWVHPLRFVSSVTLSHVFGQFMGLFVPPLLGATLVFENSQNPADI